jgi:hypothetical protein
MPSRGLSDNFMQELEEGRFTALLKRVQADNTLCLEIRDDYINIYYRGGNLIRIVEKSPDRYEADMNRNYFGDRDDSVLRELPKLIEGESACKQWLSAIPVLKEAIDLYLGTEPSEEREYKHLVVRDNNGRHGSTSTDYFILDLEYGDVANRSQFDCVAAHWPSRSSARKNPRSPRLAFIEMKLGDGAIGSYDGSGQLTKSGLVKHLADVEKFCQAEADGSPSTRLEHLKNEMLVVFRQKHRLGLVNTKHTIESFADEKPLFIFLLGNHDPDSRILEQELERLPSTENVELRFAIGTFMGYGLFDQGIVSLDELRSRFATSIYSKN